MFREKLTNILKEKLLEIGLTGFDTEREFDAKIRQDYELRDGKIQDVYEVSFWTKSYLTDNDLIEARLYFAIIDIQTKDLLYIKTPHGYLEYKE